MMITNAAAVENLKDGSVEPSSIHPSTTRELTRVLVRWHREWIRFLLNTTIGEASATADGVELSAKKKKHQL